MTTEIETDINYDVFISYSAKDGEFAARLAEDLAATGIRVWLDQWQIQVGDSIAGAINDGMRTSRFVIVVMSPDYFTTAWTVHEWRAGLAMELNSGTTRLIPLLYRDCDIPPILRTKVWVDFRDQSQYPATLSRLVRDLLLLASDNTVRIGETEHPKVGERIDQLDAGMVSDLKKALQEAVDAFRTTPSISTGRTSAEVVDP